MKMKTYLLLFVLFLLCISFPAAMGQEDAALAGNQDENPAPKNSVLGVRFGQLDSASEQIIWNILSDEGVGDSLLIVTTDPRLKNFAESGISVQEYLNKLDVIFGDDRYFIEDNIFFLPADVIKDPERAASESKGLSSKKYDACQIEIGEGNKIDINCQEDESLTDVYPALFLKNEYRSDHPAALVPLVEMTKTPEETVTEEVAETPEETVTEEVAETPEETVTEEVTETPEETVTEEVTETPEETVTEKVTETTEEVPTTVVQTSTSESGSGGSGNWLSKNWLFLVGGVVLLAGAGVGIGVIGRGKNNDEDNHKDKDHDDDNEDYGHGGDDEGPDDSEGPLAGRTDPPARHTGNTIKPVPTVTTISRLGVYHCSSCLGQGKRNYQEDALWVSEKDPVRPIVCAVIADGMGGMENGKESSALAIKIISSRVEQFLQSGANMDDIPAFLRQMAIDANEAIYEMNSSQGMNGGATLICTLIIKNWLYWINIGDSRIYLYRDGMLAAISEEHELENRMYNGMISGEVDLYDIREMQYRELRKLTSNLGRSSVTIIDQNFIPYRLHQGDKLLLCSDGISGSLTEDEIIECMRDLDPIANCSWLKEKVEQLDKPGQDNYSAIVVACATEDGNEN